MKDSRIRKRALKMTLLLILGILLNAFPVILEYETGIHMPLLFTGTILVTILSGALPGMLSATGSVLLEYLYVGFLYGFTFVNLDVPVYRVLYGVLIAILIYLFIGREMYRKPWSILLVILILSVMIWLMDKTITAVISGYYITGDENRLADVWRTLKKRFSPESFSSRMESLWVVLLRISVSVAVSLTIFHLLPGKLKRELRDISWMQEPLSVAKVRQIRKKSASYRFSLRSKITLLLITAIILSTVIISVIGLRNTEELFEENYCAVTKQAGMYTETLVSPELAEEFLRKGPEAESYGQTKEMLKRYVTYTAHLSRLTLLHIADGRCTVVLDVNDDAETELSFGESFVDDTDKKELADYPPELLDNWSVYEYRDGKYSVYALIWPILDEGGDPVLIVFPEVRVSSISENAVLFVIRVVIEFSGFFILLIAFGFWLSRYYMVYPITSMSFRADHISENLNDLVSLNQNIQELDQLGIFTADETETLYRSICEMAQSVSGRMKEVHTLFVQTAEALAGAIDAKDRYTNGHSHRVAEYSLRIAKEAGKSEEECERVYFAALLHDVGKIGVPIEILSKKGKLTDEEFEQIKKHPVIGSQILSSIKQSPWLSIGARYHHERYDGKGYPEGLKGKEIPEIARIIAVADAYDAMTSNRSYRSAIPQHIVREELVKGTGTQFDPEFAGIMIRMVDEDTEYRMQESEDRGGEDKDI